ncbi:transposase [Nonomuraea polychroma]|uniref:transposase n=1 Tax=Nonomuraea polychroma TaxID=46176 RepID=UPI003D8AAA80
MIEVCDSFCAPLVGFNGEHDHVHLLVHHPHKVALPVLINSLTGVSVQLLRKEFPQPYPPAPVGADTCGLRPISPHPWWVPLSIIRECIENQKPGLTSERSHTQGEGSDSSRA